MATRDDLVDPFARRGEDRFHGVAFDEDACVASGWPNGVPRFDEACADVSAATSMEHIPGAISISHRRLSHRGHESLRVCFIAFDVNAFDVQAFERVGVTLPPGIARAVLKRQAAYCFGRWAARCAMAAIGAPPEDVMTGPHHEPLWPPGLIGSISHGNGLAAAIVLQQRSHRGVGIDVEKVVGDGMQATFVPAVLDTAEFARLRSVATDMLPLNLLLTIAFSAKESLYKASFGAVGRCFGFEAARLAAVDLSRQRVALVLQQDLCDSLRAGRVCWVHYARQHPEAVFTSCLW